MNTKHVFSLVCPPEIEEAVLDALLTHLADEVFTSMPAFSHGTASGRLSAAEKVMGRSRSVFVQVLVTTEEVQALRELLARDFAGTGIRYWLTGVTMEGEVA